MAMKHITDLQVLDAVDRSKAGDKRWPYEILSAETGECSKVTFKCMERCEDRGLLESGVSTRSGWVTEKGRQLQAAAKLKKETTP